MAKKTRSAKGEIVDFDLIEIKSQIASTPKTINVEKREEFINRKLRRRIKKIKKNIDKIPVNVDANITDNTDVNTEEVNNTEDK